jgi:hypothetical protein
MHIITITWRHISKELSFSVHCTAKNVISEGLFSTLPFKQTHFQFVISVLKIGVVKFHGLGLNTLLAEKDNI